MIKIKIFFNFNLFYKVSQFENKKMRKGLKIKNKI